jgi:LPXTG-motif cell wall-anchored protein
VDTGNLTEGMLDVTPKTGDPIHPKWFLSLGLACLSIILFMKKDKNVKVKTA